MTHKRPKYRDSFREKAVQRAKKKGIRPTVMELGISRNSLRKWIKQSKEGMESFYGFDKCTSSKIEATIVDLREHKPNITLKGIQEYLKKEKEINLSISGIHGILERFGMAGKNFFPLQGQNTPQIRRLTRLTRILLTKGKFKKAAILLNKLPALSDFSVLKNIPSHLLSVRRKAEQLGVLLGSLPMEEMYKRAKRLREQCEKENFFFTGLFVSTIEMNALNFLGCSKKVFPLFNKYSQYLNNLQPSLKYTFLMECFISFMFEPEKYPEGTFRNFPYDLQRFVLKLPEGVYRAQWYDAMSACYQMRGKINKALKWMKKLHQELSIEYRTKYLPEYLSLLVEKGEYSEVLSFDEYYKDISTPSFLRISLAKGNALMGIGRSEEALEIVLNTFYRAKKEDLYPAMIGFTFFIACCYSALKERIKAKEYLEMALKFSKKIEKTKKLMSLLIGLSPPVSCRLERDARIHLTNLYLSACKSLRKKDYLKAHKFAEKRGLLGFFRRIILLHPKAVIKLLRKGKETYLPKVFFNLPIFREEIPRLQLFLLKGENSIFYGNRKIDISPNRKDFHLLVYLLLHRKNVIEREKLFDIFYRKTQKPYKSLTKALSRIRSQLNLSTDTLSLTKEGVCFNKKAQVDLEDFESRYKTGKISERVGEIEQALKEYGECYNLYKRSPFEKMGYYYNFAEDRRTFVRYAYENICKTLINEAEKKGNTKTFKRIKQKLEKENLVFE